MALIDFASLKLEHILPESSRMRSGYLSQVPAAVVMHPQRGLLAAAVFHEVRVRAGDLSAQLPRQNAEGCVSLLHLKSDDSSEPLSGHNLRRRHTTHPLRTVEA